MPGSYRMVHVMSFFLFGMPFMMYHTLANQIYVLKKSYIISHKQYLYLFDGELYTVLK